MLDAYSKSKTSKMSATYDIRHEKSIYSKNDPKFHFNMHSIILHLPFVLREWDSITMVRPVGEGFRLLAFESTSDSCILFPTK